MKKYKIYIITIALTFIIGLPTYYLSDYSRRVKLIYGFIGEEEKKKIINSYCEKIESDSMKSKMELSLKIFGQKIENDEYDDEHLKSLLIEFQKLTESTKIDSTKVEEFYSKVNRDF